MTITSLNAEEKKPKRPDPKELIVEWEENPFASAYPAEPGYEQSLKLPKPACTPPVLTVYIIIDQCAWHIFSRHKEFLTGGIQTLLKRGKLYTHARFPHGRPATATGHAALATGTYGETHGYIANSWHDRNGKEIGCTDDTVYNAAVFNPLDPETPYSYGVSSRLLMADGIADQFCKKNHACYALSLKDRAAVPLAGKRGKAIWCDEQTGLFTSSKAYFPALPDWLQEYNTKIGACNSGSLSSRFNRKQSTPPEHTCWQPIYPENHPAYQHAHSDYRHAARKTGLFNTEHPLPQITGTESKKAGEKLLKKRTELINQTPEGNQRLLDCAHALITTHNPTAKNQLLLALSLSTLDLIGHFYGPESHEAIDMLYQIDRQLDHFISEIEKKIDPKEIIWVLTSDHGIMPIPELLSQEGIEEARRIDSDMLVSDLNRLIQHSYGYTNAITAFNIPYFHINKTVKTGLSPEKLNQLHHDCAELIMTRPGIAQVIRAPLSSLKENNWFKKQYYPGRSGDLLVTINPFTYLTNYSGGTSHCSPYSYDTRIPLIIAGAGRITPEVIHAPVSPLQIPATLAHLLCIDRPAQAESTLLPGV